jgi:hypothetical protein
MMKKGIEGMEEGTQREEKPSELGEIVKKKEKLKNMEFSGILNGEGRITLFRNDRRRLYIKVLIMMMIVMNERQSRSAICIF